MHMGHCRGAVVGDALASLLEYAGYQVTREYYVNDAGAQVDVLARSAHLRYQEALGRQIGNIPEGLYPGDYLKPVGEQLASEFGERYVDEPEQAWLEAFRRRTVAAMLELIRADLATLGVHHDLFASEQEVQESGAVDRAFALLADKGMVYTGTLPPPKGKAADDWEPTELLLFRSTAFGDDQDRPIRKSDGSWTYFAADTAYHMKKLEASDELINVWGRTTPALSSARRPRSRRWRGGLRSTSRSCRWCGCCAQASWSRCPSVRAASSALRRWSRRSARTWCASPCSPARTTRRWISTSPKSSRRRRTIRFLRPICARAHLVPAAQGGGRAGRLDRAC
jgi:hypothetical protein